MRTRISRAATLSFALLATVTFAGDADIEGTTSTGKPRHSDARSAATATLPCVPRGKLPAALLTCRNWITFQPPRPFNPDQGVSPSEAELLAVLRQLSAEGWRGVVTYSLDGSLRAVPRLAKEAGFTHVVAGLYWLNNTQLARERTAALSEQAWIDAFVLGNEGLEDGRYSRDRLAEEIARLRADTRRPIATSETFRHYAADASLLMLGDFAMPNLQFWFDTNVRSPAQAAAIVHDQFRALVALAGERAVVVKESWWPTAGESAASEENQTEYFRRLAALPVRFVFGEAYDQHWKVEALRQGSHWGMHTDLGRPKLAIRELRRLYTGRY